MPSFRLTELFSTNDEIQEEKKRLETIQEVQTVLTEYLPNLYIGRDLEVKPTREGVVITSRVPKVYAIFGTIELVIKEISHKAYEGTRFKAIISRQSAEAQGKQITRTLHCSTENQCDTLCEALKNLLIELQGNYRQISEGQPQWLQEALSQSKKIDSVLHELITKIYECSFFAVQDSFEELKKTIIQLENYLRSCKKQ